MSYPGDPELDELILTISKHPLDFGISSPVYNRWATQLPQIINNLYEQDIEGRFSLKFFGDIQLPFVSFGSINSSHLFGLDEIILFVFYWNNRSRYSSVYDLGANIGLHSIMLGRCGYDVNSFEPDPVHLEILHANLKRNQCDGVKVHPLAVSHNNEKKDFIRVEGNTTGSHLAGMKENPYGDLTTFSVECIEFNSILDQSPSLIKMDIEGAESTVILSTQKSQWKNTDMLLEVGSVQNAELIWSHLSNIGVNMFSQKSGWKQVESVRDMPFSYKEGSLFLSTNSIMPW